MCDVNGRQSPLEENLSCVLTNGGSIVCWGSMNPTWKQFHVVHVPIQKEKRILNGHVMPRYSLILLYGIFLKTCGVLHMHLICLQSKADPLDTNALKMECWQNISSLSNTETYSRTIFPPPHPFKFYLEVKWGYSCPVCPLSCCMYHPTQEVSLTRKMKLFDWLSSEPPGTVLCMCVFCLCVFLESGKQVMARVRMHLPSHLTNDSAMSQMRVSLYTMVSQDATHCCLKSC